MNSIPRSSILMKPLVIIAGLLTALVVLLVVNHYLVDLPSTVFGCDYKAFRTNLPLQHVYTLSDIARAAQRNQIPVLVQTITYDHIATSTTLVPQLQQLLGHDG